MVGMTVNAQTQLLGESLVQKGLIAEEQLRQAELEGCANAKTLREILIQKGFISEDPNKFLLLTEQGDSIAKMVEHNFKILSTFFVDVLGVERDIALGDACKMEHLMSLETGRRLVWLMRYIMSNKSELSQLNQTMACFRPGCESVEYCPVCDGDCLAGDDFECEMHDDNQKKNQSSQQTTANKKTG